MTRVPNTIASSALARPGHPAVVTAHASVSAGALQQRVATRAAAWVRQGVQIGDAIALGMDATIDHLVNLHAASWLGAKAVIFPVDATEAERIALAQTVLLDWVLPSAQLPMATAARRLLASEDGSQLPERLASLEEEQVILFTSGSTGAPKAIPLTRGQLLFAATGSAIRLGHLPTDRWLCPLPLHHIGGLSVLLRTSLYGTTAVLQSPFDEGAANAWIDSGEVTQVSLVPVMLERLLKNRGDEPFPESLRFILLGGAAPGEALLHRCRAIGAPVSLTWGMTETASQVCTTEPGMLDGPVGAPLAFARVDANAGVLRVSGSCVGQPLLTRDHGFIDSTGRVAVTGRADDVIVSGGKNVSAVELERALRAHPSVVDAGVTGVADVEWGSRPIAFVVSQGAVDTAALQGYLRKTLSSYKLPREFRFVDALPRTSLGKLCRASLLDLEFKPESAQPVDEFGGGLAGFESSHVDESMNQANTRSEDAVVTDDTIAKGDRGVGHLVDFHSDGQTLGEPHRLLEVALGVNHGHRPVGVGKGALSESYGGDEQFLKSGVAVFEETTKKNDAGPVDFVETAGYGVLKGHRAAPPKKVQDAGT